MTSRSAYADEGKADAGAARAHQRKSLGEPAIASRASEKKRNIRYRRS